MEIEQEELYICDHAEECGSKARGHVRPHAGNTRSCKRTYCANNGMIPVKCIPYKEKEEPEKSCEELYICDHDKECNNPHCCGHEPHLKDKHCMNNSFCDYADCEVRCIPYKEVHENQDVDIAFSIHYPYCWDTVTYPTLASALWEISSPVGMACSECGQAFYSPTKPETVEDVLKRMPKTEDYISAVGYWCDMENFEKDLKAAQDRES